MRQCWIAMLCLLLLVALLPMAHTQVAAGIIANGKAATALVETTAEDESGTAFCVDAAGYFVTNEHVVEDAKASEMTLVLHPGEANQKEFTARVLRVDRDSDLALLKVDNATGLAALPLGEDSGLIETDPVTAFGYPFGKDLALADGAYPSVSVSLGHITALRSDKGGLEFIQLDASLNPGNSGGPVLDSAGHVIGIVQEGVQGASLSFAIPVHLLSAFLSKPEITLTAPAATGVENAPRVFQIGVQPFVPTATPYAVALTFLGKGDAKRTFDAVSDGPTTYKVSASPLAPSAGPKILRLTVVQDGGNLVATVADRTVHLHTGAIPLSQIQSITWTGSGAAIVQTTSGKTITGRLTGLNAVPATVAGAKQVVDFSGYHEISVEEAAPPPPSVDYRITVKQKDKIVGEQTGTVTLASGAVTVHQPVAAAPKIAAAKQVSPGILVVAADSWPTSDTGFAQAPAGSTARFVRNLAALFHPGGGDFLIYSTHWGFGAPFQQALREAGYQVTVTMQPGPLAQYDAIFVGGNGDVDCGALADYLAHGGHVYVATGTADIHPDEKAFWNRFLWPYGLQVDSGPHIDDRMNVTSFGYAPLFDGVQGLLVRGPYNITLRSGDWPNTRIISTQAGNGYWAISYVPAVPYEDDDGNS